jgi:tetratricopeptide (TPR) repeat protein
MSGSFRSCPAPRIPGLRDSAPGAAYKRGDIIGQKYEVHGVLGVGGFGVVYLVYSRETQSVFALKTFRDEYLADPSTRERFRKEASVWVDLERHPHLVRAHLADEVGCRLFIVMEHVAPDGKGLNTLEGYLRHQPPDLAQCLRWSIQFCYGMEHAYSKGIRCHRDVKPANIMIGHGKVVKIADFGLAGAMAAARSPSGSGLSVRDGTVGHPEQAVAGVGFGTPPYMPPEQFTDAAGCDERSDIYSFGVVLYQMVSGKLPFLAPLPEVVAEAESARFWREMHRLHAQAPVPRLSSPLFPVIQRCLQKKPGRRYQGFAGLRHDLEPLLRRETGETAMVPELGTLEAWEWGNKALGLHRLGRYAEATNCCDVALELDPENAAVWNVKGLSLFRQGRAQDAVRCYDRALRLDPRDAAAWTNRGNSLSRVGLHDEAVHCHDMALELDLRLVEAWYNKGTCLARLEQDEEAIRCYDKALELDHREPRVWTNRGISLAKQGQDEEAIRCYDRALELDPRHVKAWCNMGISLHGTGRYLEAVRSYDKALEVNPDQADAWYGKGLSLLYSLSRFDEAARCFGEALKLNPQDAMAWYNRALAQEHLEPARDAVESYEQFLAHAPACWVDKVSYAHLRIRELGDN